MRRSAVLMDCRASDSGCWSSAPCPAVFAAAPNRDLDTAEVTYCGRSCRMLNQCVGSCGSRGTRWSPMRGLLSGLTGAQVGADGVNAGEILREQIRVAHRDPEPLLQEDHQLEQAQ